MTIRSTHVYSVGDGPTAGRQRSKDDAKNLLALPQDAHSWALENFATTCEGEERGGSWRRFIYIEGNLSNQLFNVEDSVHRKSVADGMITVLSEVGGMMARAETG